MSRIYVKNVHKHVAKNRLRELLSESDGKSRQFAFIGFRTEQEAQEAIRYFNKSYLDTVKN